MEINSRKQESNITNRCYKSREKEQKQANS